MGISIGGSGQSEVQIFDNGIKKIEVYLPALVVKPLIKEMPPSNLIRSISDSKLYRNTELNLINVHNGMALFVKTLKRAFIKKGKMMSEFEYITSQYYDRQFGAIARTIQRLHKDYLETPFHGQRYFKYKELIGYCEFLLLFEDYSTNRTLIRDNGVKLLTTVNLGHEIGFNIELHVAILLKLYT